MRNFSKRKSKAGKSIGWILLILGSLLTIVLICLVATASSLPKILVSGPCFIGVGIGMLIFSGGNITLQEMRKNGAKHFWTEAPLFHKIVWVISGLIGLGISFKIMTETDFL